MLTGPGLTSGPLRIGILLDGLIQPAWIDAALAEILAAPELELALVILDASVPDASQGKVKHRSALGKIIHWALKWRQSPYWAYIALDNRLWPAQDDPFRLVDVSNRLSGIAVVSVNTVRKKYSDWFPDAAVEAILEHRLAVAQRFGFRILKGRALEIAQHGVWSFHHGDYLAYRGGPAGFWEVLDGTRQTGMLLQRLTEDLDDGTPIASISSRTDLRSVVLNRRQYYPLGPKLLARELIRLQRSGPAAPKREWSCYSAPLYVDPMPRAMATLGARLVKRSIGSTFARVGTVRHAGLSIVFRSDPGGAPHGALYRARSLPPPVGAQWLDPCASTSGAQRFVMVSQKVKNQPAHLMLLPVEEKVVRLPGLPIYAESLGDVRSPAPFTWDQTPYTYVTVDGAPGVRLLRCVQWPATWVMTDCILSELPASSVVVAEIDRTWWLFVGVPAAPGRIADLLYLYASASPIGPWSPHAQNPVRLGDDGVCPAGPPFSFAGHWYRPGRDLTAGPGCCVAMMRIEQLDLDTYRETRVGLIQPTSRLHLTDVTSVSAIEGLTVFGTTRTTWKTPWGARPPEVSI